MDPIAVGELVTVADGGPKLDGIVFEVPSRAKVVVAVVDRVRGPVLRTVGAQTLSERTDEGPDDHALRLLIRRTPLPGRDGGPGRSGPGHGSRGHTRPPTHRPTGR
jgi:hypothetical protein